MNPFRRSVAIITYEQIITDAVSCSFSVVEFQGNGVFLVPRSVELEWSGAVIEVLSGAAWSGVVL